MAKKHQRQTKARVKGGIIDKDMPIHASSVAIVCPKDGADPRRLRSRSKATGAARCGSARRCGREL